MACQNVVGQQRIKGRKSMVFLVRFFYIGNVCKRDRWRPLRFGSVKQGLVLSGSKGGLRQQFKAGKLWPICLVFRRTPAIFKVDPEFGKFDATSRKFGCMCLNSLKTSTERWF